MDPKAGISASVVGKGEPIKFADDDHSVYDVEHEATPAPTATSASAAEEDDKLLDLSPHISVMAGRLNRRNSISLPAGLELDHLSLPQEMPIRDDDSDSSELYSDGEEGGVSEEEEEVNSKVPLRSRRKSVMPKIKINDDDLLDLNEQDGSPHNSITSINSIASLLKEKLAMSMPAMFKNKRPQEYKLKAFVAILFLCIVFLVGFAHVYYHQQVLQRAYFDNIRFNKDERTVRIFNDDMGELLHGNMATFLGHHHHVYHCLHYDEMHDGSVCMEWMNAVRFYLNYKEFEGGQVRCYSVLWKSLVEGIYPRDCYDWSEGKGHWYGGGEMPGTAWPLDKGTVNMSPFITGDVSKNQWGNVLSRYFINSKGVSIHIDPATPLYLSINEFNSSQFCLKAKYDDFAFVNHPERLPQLNYSICTAKNMKILHAHLAEKNQWDGLKKEDLEHVNSLLTEPIWQIPTAASDQLTEAAIYNYTEEVIALGFLRQGHVLLNEYWQTNIGDFTLDPVRFPTMEETINIIHRRGFRIVFTVQPYISTESFNFKEAVAKGLLVKERDSQHDVPSLVHYKTFATAGMLDATKNHSKVWLQANIKALVDRYNIDAFFVDAGTAYEMPHYYSLETKLINPDFYKNYFTSAVIQGASSVMKNVVGVSSAIFRPRATIFVSLPPFASTWEAMRNIIPTVLTYGISGYPFVMPGPVGGDFDGGRPVRTGNVTSAEEALNAGLPNKELYMRWLQLATFLPVLRYSHLPNKYGDEKLLETAKFLTALRLKTVNPLLKKYVRDALDSGLPIIRPLWMLDPTDPACHMVGDEFSVGEELIVAPILVPGNIEREVYLPSGVWKDGIDGSLRKGSRWLHNYRVALDKVAHFIRMPDNTRF